MTPGHMTPGSHKARLNGCTCSPVDNHHGKGAQTMHGRVWQVADACQMHNSWGPTAGDDGEAKTTPVPKPAKSWTKDELEAWGLEYFSTDFDKRKTKDDLFEQAMDLYNGAP